MFKNTLNNKSYKKTFKNLKIFLTKLKKPKFTDKKTHQNLLFKQVFPKELKSKKNTQITCKLRAQTKKKAAWKKIPK